MTFFILKVAQLGTQFLQDPSLSLMKYIKASWDLPSVFTPLKASVYFDNKWARADFANNVIIEQLRIEEEDQMLGKSRIRYHHYFTVQIFCKGESAINNRFLIEQHIEDIINGNPIAERGDGIDEMSITGWQPVKNWSDDQLTNSTVETKSTTQSRSKAVICLIYDKYQST